MASASALATVEGAHWRLLVLELFISCRTLSMFTDTTAMQRKPGPEWKLCFDSPISLPLGYYLGVTAETGGLSDIHDVEYFHLYEYDAISRQHVVISISLVLLQATIINHQRGLIRRAWDAPTVSAIFESSNRIHHLLLLLTKTIAASSLKAVILLLKSRKNCSSNRRRQRLLSTSPLLVNPSPCSSEISKRTTRE